MTHIIWADLDSGKSSQGRRERSNRGWYSDEKWNVACPVSKQRMSQSAVIVASRDGKLVSPEGTQEAKEYLWFSSHQTAATPYYEPEDTQYLKTQHTGPRYLRCISKEWFLWAHILVYACIKKNAEFLNVKYLVSFIV